MKAKSLVAKPFIIPHKSGSTLLAPAANFVVLGEGYNEEYVNKLVANGSIAVLDETTKKATTAKKAATKTESEE